MWSYYLKLSWLSIRKTPILSLLMVLGIAVGIATCLTTFTVYSVISSNPLAHKNETTFAVQLDSWGADEEYHDANGLPEQLTWRDASAIFESAIPDKTVVMRKSGISMQNADMTGETTVQKLRMTTRDFWGLFDVNFVEGGPWDEEADRQGAKVVVINESLSNLLFGTDERIGQAVSLEGDLYTVVGVVSDSWHMVPKVYDLNNGAFDSSPAAYIPIMNVKTRQFQSWGNVNGWANEKIQSYEDFLASESVWIQVWVELSSIEKKIAFENYILGYIEEQKKSGRFQRPARYALSTPEKWLEINEAVPDDSRILVVLSIAFLTVCLVNTVVILLAKFLRKSSEAGIRRALGASRKDIFTQHICEALMIGFFGGVLGLAFSWQGLAGVRVLYEHYDQIAILSGFTLVAALSLAILTSILSGVFPAWRISHTQPASYLKTN